MRDNLIALAVVAGIIAVLVVLPHFMQSKIIDRLDLCEQVCRDYDLGHGHLEMETPESEQRCVCSDPKGAPR